MFLGDLSLIFKIDYFNIVFRLDFYIKRFQFEIEFNLMGLKRKLSLNYLGILVIFIFF